MLTSFACGTNLNLDHCEIRYRKICEEQLLRWFVKISDTHSSAYSVTNISSTIIL